MNEAKAFQNDDSTVGSSNFIGSMRLNARVDRNDSCMLINADMSISPFCEYHSNMDVKMKMSDERCESKGVDHWRW